MLRDECYCVVTQSCLCIAILAECSYARRSEMPITPDRVIANRSAAYILICTAVHLSCALIFDAIYLIKMCSSRK